MERTSPISYFRFSARVNMDETMELLRGLSALSVAIIGTPGLYMVRTLLDRGASATKKTLMRKTPEELANDFHRKDVYNFFRGKRNHRSREFIEN